MPKYRHIVHNLQGYPRAVSEFPTPIPGNEVDRSIQLGFLVGVDSNLPPVISGLPSNITVVGFDTRIVFTAIDPEGTTTVLTISPAFPGDLGQDFGNPDNWEITYPFPPAAPQTYVITATDEGGASSTFTVTFEPSILT